MSIKSYEKAIELINLNKNMCFFAGERSYELIKKAEEFLGLTFSPIAKDFFKTFGAGSVGAEEVYGITNENFLNASLPNGVWLTNIEREEVQMPKGLFVISDRGNGEFYCLDHSSVSEFEEPKIVVYVPGVDNEHQKYEVIADDFGDYLLQIVQKETE